MNRYSNEDVAWQRLQDLQREMENARIWDDRMLSLLDLVGRLLVRAWHLAGLAARRAPRYRPGVLDADGGRVNRQDVA